MESVFTENLYDTDELERLNLAVENGKFNILTCILNPGGLTREKELDIQRVLDILRPRVAAPPFQELIKQAVGSKKNAIGDEEESRPRGRPKGVPNKIVADAI